MGSYMYKNGKRKLDYISLSIYHFITELTDLSLFFEKWDLKIMLNESSLLK